MTELSNPYSFIINKDTTFSSSSPYKIIYPVVSSLFCTSSACQEIRPGATLYGYAYHNSQESVDDSGNGKNIPNYVTDFYLIPTLSLDESTVESYDLVLRFRSCPIKTDEKMLACIYQTPFVGFTRDDLTQESNGSYSLIIRNINQEYNDSVTNFDDINTGDKPVSFSLGVSLIQAVIQNNYSFPGEFTFQTNNVGQSEKDYSGTYNNLTVQDLSYMATDDTEFLIYKTEITDNIYVMWSFKNIHNLSTPYDFIYVYNLPVGYEVRYVSSLYTGLLPYNSDENCYKATEKTLGLGDNIKIILIKR